jgi:hypothetical protein
MTPPGSPGRVKAKAAAAPSGPSSRAASPIPAAAGSRIPRLSKVGGAVPELKKKKKKKGTKKDTAAADKAALPRKAPLPGQPDAKV